MIKNELRFAKYLLQNTHLTCACTIIHMYNYICQKYIYKSSVDNTQKI